MSQEEKELYEFGPFRLDISEHTFTRTDGVQNGSLPEKAFQSLCVLVRNQGRLLTKKQLLDQVWPDSFVEENNLDKCIHIIRHVLGEKPGENKYIETVRSHGYRFVVEVRQVGSEETPDVVQKDDGFQSATNGNSSAESLRLSNRAEMQRSGAVVALADWRGETYERDIVERASRSTSAEQFTEPITELELAPTKSINENSAVETRANGFPKITKRRKGLLRGLSFLLIGVSVGFVFLILLRVLIIAGLVLFQYENTLPGVAPNPLVGMAGDLRNMVLIPVGLGWFVGIGLFLFGNARIVYAIFEKEDSKANSKLIERIMASVIILMILAVAIPNLISSYSEATRVRQLQQTSIGDKKSLAVLPLTNNPEANRFYLLAMNLGEERGVQNVLKSLEYLDRSVALDPNYALAWAGKAHIHRDIVGHTDTGQHEHYQKSMEAIKKALAIDPNLSDAYSALCRNKNGYEYDVTGAETACKRAVELDPNSPVAHKTYANFLYSRGRFDEAIFEIKTAMDLQPVSYRNQQMYALTLYYARRYDEAAEQFKRLIELNPNHSFIHGRLIMVLEAQGKESEAFEYLVEMLTLQKTNMEKIERYKSAYRTAGWRGVVIERVKIVEADGHQGYFQMACLYANIGNKDKALEYLEKAYQERSFLIAILPVEPQLDSLRNDPRFADLIRRVEGK